MGPAVVPAGGAKYMGGVLLPGLAPTHAWRFGFGARSGPNYAMLEERHDVRNFEVALGASLTALDLAGARANRRRARPPPARYARRAAAATRAHGAWAAA